MERFEKKKDEYAVKCGFENWERLLFHIAIRKGSSIGKITEIEHCINSIVEEYTKECIAHNLERARLEANRMHTEIAKSNLPMEHYTPISNRINALKKSIVKDDNIVLL
ncbi:hypothetical protein CMU19_04340 [Elizabethkingia anophelis]|nr:hypothetical protein [Elizabethkingia anophelis]